MARAYPVRSGDRPFVEIHGAEVCVTMPLEECADRFSISPKKHYRCERFEDFKIPRKKTAQSHPDFARKANMVAVEATLEDISGKEEWEIGVYHNPEFRLTQSQVMQIFGV